MPPTVIVIPCYNEAARLDCDAILRFMEKSEDISLLLVDDGSRDKTRDVLQQLAASQPQKISFLAITDNVGKAEAIRAGVIKALGTGCDSVGFFDADLATPLDEIIRFTSFLAASKNCKFIMGCRIKRLGAEITRQRIRHGIGRTIATLIAMVLNLPVYDTQCGAKLLSSDIAEKLFARPFVSTWLFDVELLARAIHYYGRQQVIDMVIELPLKTWRDISGSKVKYSYFYKIPVELYRIHKLWLKDR